jgi:hypothetical protein
LTRRGRSPLGEAKARVSIDLRKSLSKEMDGRVKPVKPGHDAVGSRLHGTIMRLETDARQHEQAHRAFGG